MLMAALTLERLWQPFVYGIEKTEYTPKEKEDFLQIEELRMDMIWERVKSGKVNPKHLSIFDETMEREYELTDVDRNVFGAELDGRAAYLGDRIVGVAKSFFTVSKFDIGQCAQTVSNGLSVIMWEINNMLYIDAYEKSYQIFKVNSELTKYIKNNHPAVLEELQRVEMDMELGTVNKLILTIGFDFIIPFSQLFIRKKIDLGKFLIRYFSSSLINIVVYNTIDF